MSASVDEIFLSIADSSKLKIGYSTDHKPSEERTPLAWHKRKINKFLGRAAGRKG